jgi:hypothetical protein
MRGQAIVQSRNKTTNTKKKKKSCMRTYSHEHEASFNILLRRFASTLIMSWSQIRKFRVCAIQNSSLLQFNLTSKVYREALKSVQQIKKRMIQLSMHLDDVKSGNIKEIHQKLTWWMCQWEGDMRKKKEKRRCISAIKCICMCMWSYQIEWPYLGVFI